MLHDQRSFWLMASTFKIIQGGMGVGVSNWALAKSVAQSGELGVVSGTGIATVLARRLQRGDTGGHLRRALDHFPIPAVAQRVWDRYFVAGGIADHAAFKATPMPMIDFSSALEELTVVAAFAEVFLAKEGHGGVVGMNLLEKVQTPTLATLFGAILAGVDYVLMGAGIPRFIPGVLDALSQMKPVELKIDVEAADCGDSFISKFSPAAFMARDQQQASGASHAGTLRRPRFLAIVSSATLAMTLARKSNGKVDGFIVETSVAGGHNAPPRGPLQLTQRGEPIYGPRDEADLAKIAEIGLPFYLAGGFGTHEQLCAALAKGAAGIQVGTAFAFCDQSGIRADLKRQVLELARARQAQVFTDPQASPTGFPFKILAMPETISETELYLQRERKCDLGYLRKLYKRSDNTLGYRCAAEPVEDYVAKSGQAEDTTGRKCLCNALFATIGLGQTDSRGEREIPIITAGDDVTEIYRYLPRGQNSYSSGDVIEKILNG
jgi:NAD(P)H-dependent flavin oxidoreductase YrpB (nitropropane dioxygenase family)